MKDSLQPGLKFEFQFQVPETKTVPNLYPESPEFQLMPRVLATGYMVGLFAPLADASDALLPIVLSMFPLTAPVLMVMRLVDSAVPWWHLLIAIVGTYLAAYLALRAAGDMFRAQNLLSGQPFSLRRYLRLMTGRM